MFSLNGPTPRFGAQYIRFVFRHQAANPKYLSSFAVGVFTIFWVSTLVAGEFLKNPKANVGLFLLVFISGSVLILKSTRTILSEANCPDSLFALGLSEEYRRSLYLYQSIYRLSLLLSICLVCNLLSIVLVKPSLVITGCLSALMLSGYVGQAIWLSWRSRKSAMGVVREESKPRMKFRRGVATTRSIRFPTSNRTIVLLLYQSLASFRRDPLPFAICFLGLPSIFVFLRCAYADKVDPALSLVVLALASIYPLIGLNRDIAEHDFWKTTLPYSPRRFFAKNALLFSLVWALNFILGLLTFLLPGSRGLAYLFGAFYAYLGGMGAVWYITAHYRTPSHCVQVTTIAGVALFYLYLTISRAWLPF